MTTFTQRRELCLIHCGGLRAMEAKRQGDMLTCD